MNIIGEDGSFPRRQFVAKTLARNPKAKQNVQSQRPANDVCALFVLAYVCVLVRPLRENISHIFVRN